MCRFHGDSVKISATWKTHTKLNACSIQHLTKVRENLVKSSDNLDAADKKLQDVTIKRLTYGNPTMKAMFDAAGKD